MEKLINLYYEHKLDLLKRDMRVNGASEREIELADIEKVDEYELEKNLNKLSDLKPFIKWLVENDKINKDLISRVLIRAYVSPENHVSLECEFHDYYESLLMLLSISDTPIEDLILYLN